jgi:SAM-dependent methyltransferase
MNDFLIDASVLPDGTDGCAHKLERTHPRAMASMAFTLQWSSEQARHTDCLVARKLNLWRDIIPSPMKSSLVDRPPGHEESRRFRVGELVPDYRDSDCLVIPHKAFNRHLRRCYIEPRSGRFYPKGFIGGVRGIFPEDITPFRLGAVEDGGLVVDLNHPLAGREISLQARILDIWDGREEHGGACQDIAEMVTSNGPGMQARWRSQPTDFWSDLPFLRLDPSPDNEFYAKARMVHHLDSTALDQVARLYGRLLPVGSRLLDLMSSWTSHLPVHLHPSHVVGLGMNAEELDANPLLGQRLVHDLNLDPRLPFDTGSFDAVICTVSVEYLTKPLEVFAEVRRVLRPGGRFVATFANRWFPPKVIKVWQDVHEFERMGLVLEYFHQTGFSRLETWSIRGLPRPRDDKYVSQMDASDPIYAVWGERSE